MVQIRAFAKRLDVCLDNLGVETRVIWDWEAKGRVYETAPHSFDIDVLIVSSSAQDKVIAPIEAAKRGALWNRHWVVQTRFVFAWKTPDGWQDV